ncbi:kinase-like domain-containing protein [Suillus subalutaceus]|uniref:kinase-like domain-containing protein n=1 Tax=Suillus subalutaceus TaxID=48586 RepID=UPI001B86290E|nr:kinase-like domain-containing protein [Suillus subalutaceus]KAG1837703.1 kinase-like domain-containing protein [Suillus subalutaceus]
MSPAQKTRRELPYNRRYVSHLIVLPCPVGVSLMSVFNTIVSPTLGVLEIAGAASGVPYAQGAGMALQAINTACNQVAIHKRKSAQLAHRCTSLLNLISDHAVGPAGDEMRSSLEDAEFVLYAVRDRIQKWSQYSKVKSFFKRSQIENDLDRCQNDVNAAMERLHVKNPLSVMIMQKTIYGPHENESRSHGGKAGTADDIPTAGVGRSPTAQRWGRQVLVALDVFLSWILIIPLQRLIQLCLQSPRENSQSPDRMLFGGPIVESPSSSRSSSLEVTVQTQIQSALTDLRRLTNVPPTLKVLNNQVKKVGGSTPICSGTYSDIWLGEMLGEKASRSLKIITDPTKARRMTKRYEHEMNVWEKLKHDNILTIYGVITNLGPIHIVSTWQENGNVLEYRTKNPDINPLTLATAKGIEYLHGSNIVHGNLKCNNMLVSSEGVVCIGDFGHTQVLDEVLGREGFTAYTGSSNVRWNAPELLGGDDVKPTKASDVFAFGMSILELVTKQAPYSHRKRDLTVIMDINDGRLPLRPTEPEDVSRWMHDKLWELLNRCWYFMAQERINIGEVTICLDGLAEYIGNHPNWQTEEADVEIVQ